MLLWWNYVTSVFMSGESALDYKKRTSRCQCSPCTVEESLGRLRELEGKINDYHARQKVQHEELQDIVTNEEYPSNNEKFKGGPGSRQERLDSIKQALKDRKVYKEGRLIHKTEQR